MTPEDKPTFTLSYTGVHATAVLRDGKLIVLAGSTASRDVKPSLNERCRILRQELTDSRRWILDEKQQVFILQEDVTFSTPSFAAAVLRGVSSNGIHTWKHTSGMTYGEWLEQQKKTSTGDEN